MTLAVVALALSPAFAYQAAAPVAAHDEDTIDKLLGMVGPSEPSQLTEKKRFHLYLLSAAGPVPLLGEAGGAAFNQWLNTPPEWRQGWNAYGKRWGSNLASNAVRQTITYGTSVVFHEDNRYFSSHRQGFRARAAYAVLSTVTARHPDERRTFSISAVTGIVGASAISSIWGPSSFKGLGNISRNAGVSFGTTAGFNIIREYLPDLLHRTHK